MKLNDGGRPKQTFSQRSYKGSWLIVTIAGGAENNSLIDFMTMTFSKCRHYRAIAGVIWIEFSSYVVCYYHLKMKSLLNKEHKILNLPLGKVNVTKT